jgi:hypothetical protein
MLDMLNDLFSGLGCVSSAVGIFISLVVDPHWGLSGFLFPSYFLPPCSAIFHFFFSGDTVTLNTPASIDRAGALVF